MSSSSRTLDEDSSATSSSTSSIRKSSTPQILTRAALPSLIQKLDAGDVLECYALTRMVPLLSTSATIASNSTSSSTIWIQTTAVALRYSPRTQTHNTRSSSVDKNNPPTNNKPQQLELTLEYGPQRTGAALERQAMPLVHMEEDSSSHTEKSGGYVTWENEGKLYYTKGSFVKSEESSTTTSAYYMASLTGAVYSQLLEWALDYPRLHPRYQPLQVIVNDRIVYKSSSSQDFVQHVWEALTNMGVALEPILPPPHYALRLYATSIEKLSGGDVIRYYSNEAEEEETVVVAHEAALFYQNLYSCITAIQTGDYSAYVPTMAPTTTSSLSPTGTLAPSTEMTTSLEPTITPSATEDNDETPTKEAKTTDKTPDDKDETPKNPNDEDETPKNPNDEDETPKNEDETPKTPDDEDETPKNPNDEDETTAAPSTAPTTATADEDNDETRRTEQVDESDPQENDKTEPDEPADENYKTQEETGKEQDEEAYEMAQKAADEAYEAAAEAKEAAEKQNTPEDDDNDKSNNNNNKAVANAAEAAANAAQKAADATSSVTIKAAIDGITSGDGDWVTAVLSQCFSNPQYGIQASRTEQQQQTEEANDDADKDDILTTSSTTTTTTSYAYLYLDGSNYYRVNLTFPYVNVARIDSPSWPLLPPSSGGSGGGDLIDWTLALIVIGLFVVGIFATIQQIGFPMFFPHLQKWFFSPRHYDYESEFDGHHANKTGEGFLHNFAEDVIPLSMGGRRSSPLPSPRSAFKSGASSDAVVAGGVERRRMSREDNGQQLFVDADIGPLSPSGSGEGATSIPSKGLNGMAEIGDLEMVASVGRSNSGPLNGSEHSDDKGGHSRSSSFANRSSLGEPDSGMVIVDIAERMNRIKEGVGEEGGGGRPPRVPSTTRRHGTPRRSPVEDVLDVSVPERFTRDPDLVDLPNLRSNSKVAIPVMSNRSRNNSSNGSSPDFSPLS